MDSIQNFTLFLSLSLILIITPGPDLLYVLTKGISNGQKAGLISAVGVSSGILVHTIFAALGLSIILRTSALAFTVVKICGASYLIYLGIKSILSKNAFSLEGKERVGGRKIFTQGFISNILNPKVALFFMAFLPQFISNHDQGESSVVSFIILGLIFALCTIVFLSFLGYYSGLIGKYLLRHESIATRIQHISGVVLIFLGIKLAITKNK